MLKLRAPQRARSALAYWTGRRGYQEALAAGMVRYGLNGEIAGEVADTERQHAAARLPPAEGAGR